MGGQLGMRIPLAALTLAAAIGCGSSSSSTPTTPTTPATPSTPATPTQTTSVTMSGNAFTPGAIQASPGAKVTWTNPDNINHNVTCSSPTSSTPNSPPGPRPITMPP